MEHSLNEQSYLAFTGRQEADKAIYSLKGILFGIISDKEFDAKERNELHDWVRNHRKLTRKEPFKEFLLNIEYTLHSGGGLEEIEDMYWLCQKYESDNEFYNVVTNDLQILHGICHGILSDGKIKDAEIYELDNWLRKNKHLSNYYPYDELSTLVLDIVCDRKVDEQERLKLMAYFNQFVNIQNQDIKKQILDDIHHIPISGICSTEIDVTFPGKTFCLTGIMQRISRKELHTTISGLGGTVSDIVTNKTDYLVVGDNGNQAWAFACYGRKVEKAINLRKGGHTIKIIHEYDFADVVDDIRYS